MKAYSINNKLLGMGSPTDSSGQSTPDGVTAFQITALPETAAPGGVYDLTDSDYYAITTDIYWRYSGTYNQITAYWPEFQAMATIYQFNSKDHTAENYREMNFTVSNNLFDNTGCTGMPAGYDWTPPPEVVQYYTGTCFYPGAYLNSLKSTADAYFPESAVNGPLSGTSNELELYYHDQEYPAGAEIYLNTAYGHGASPENTYGWTKYKVIGDRSNGNISAFFAPQGRDYNYMGYTNLHTTVTSVNGLYCYDYYSPNLGICSAKNFAISGFNNIDDALKFSGPPRKILAY